MLKCALWFSFLNKSCSLPYDIISFFGPRLKKFDDLCSRGMVRAENEIEP